MSAAAWRTAAAAADAEPYDYDELEARAAALRFDVAPGDRLGPPLGRLRLRRFVRRVAVVSMLCCLGWLVANDDARSVASSWWTTAAETVRDVTARPPSQAGAVATTSSDTMPRAAPRPLSSGKPASALPPEAASSTPAAVSNPAASDPAAVAPREDTVITAPVEVVTSRKSEVKTAALAAASETYVPVASGAAVSGVKLAPYQKRAQAAGLHPDVSKVLLEKLTDNDFRNASAAIEAALAETADDGVLYWPRQPRAGMAQYQVHFVEGAEPGCRRYVVTIAKSGWQTTALPMERCGVVRSAAARN